MNTAGLGRGGGHQGGHGGGGHQGGHAGGLHPQSSAASPQHAAPSHGGDHGDHGHGGHGHGYPSHFGHQHGWGGWGWGGGWWTGPWWPFFYGCTEVEVDACSWLSYGSTANMPWRGGSSSVAAKARELVGKLQSGQVVFYRFGDATGIFEFYLAQDGRNVMVDRCDDGTAGAAIGAAGAGQGADRQHRHHGVGEAAGVGETAGLGQNYLWDRYPGEIAPETPAHTLSVGLAGGLGSAPSAPSGLSAPKGFGDAATGLGGCGCGPTTWDPTTTGHHPCCDWEWGTCTCAMFLWNPATGPGSPDDPGCVYQEPNTGSTQIHLRAGQGPLGYANAADLGDPDAMADAIPAGFQVSTEHVGVGQIFGGGVGPTLTPADVPGQTTIMPAPGGGSVVTSTTIPGVTTPPALATAPAASIVPSTLPPAGAPTTVTAPSQPSTGMLLAGLLALGLGLAGAAYVVHTYTMQQGQS